MTINPIAFADEVNKQFLRYQLTAFPLSVPDMADQAKKMLDGADPDSNLVKGPYISLSRSFAEGEFIEVLIKKGLLPPAIQEIAEYKKMFAHQQKVLFEIKDDVCTKKKKLWLHIRGHMSRLYHTEHWCPVP